MKSDNNIVNSSNMKLNTDGTFTVYYTGMPENTRVHYNLGQLLIFLGQDKEAERALRRTIEIDPENMSYLQAIAQFYYTRGQFALARNIIEQMLTVNPDHLISQQMRQHINAMLK